MVELCFRLVVRRIPLLPLVHLNEARFVLFDECGLFNGCLLEHRFGDDIGIALVVKVLVLLLECL